MFDKIKKIIYHPSFIIHHLHEYGFYLFVFLLPWQTQLILRPGLYKEKWPVDYWTIGLFGTDFLLVALLLLFFANKFLRKRILFPKIFQGFRRHFRAEFILLVVCLVWIWRLSFLSFSRRINSCRVQIWNIFVGNRSILDSDKNAV
jgi:hypothetical protein